MTLDDSFWDPFVERHHGKEPAAWRGVFADPFVEMEDVFDWLLRAAERCRQGDRPQHYRLYSGSELLSDPVPHLPRPTDRSVAGYMTRLEAELGQVGLVVNELQATHPALWHRMLDFLRGLYARIGMPAAGALLDLFSGSYAKGFFGLHKDDQDVFTFVLEGEKRLLLWPFETFAAHSEAQGASPQSSWGLTRVDVEAFRDQAIVLEGEPGDLLYWPASYWHVAEAVRPGEQVTTFSLGLFRHPDPLQSIAMTMQELCDEDFATLPDTLPHPSGTSDVAAALDRARDTTRRVLSSPTFAERHDARLLERLTAFGFRVVPDPLPHEALQPTDVVCATSAQPVSWVHIGDDILWSAHGYAFRFPFHSGLERLFSRIGERREERIADWIDLATSDSSATGLPADAVLHVIGMLLRHHAIRRVRS